MKTYTKKSAGQAKPHNHSKKLKLPIRADFAPSERFKTGEHALELSWQYLPKLMSRPGFWEERLEKRDLPEFDLAHPSKVAPTYPADLLDSILPKS
jgi:hypothetical protein